MKSVYHAHSDIVDANTLCGGQYVRSSDGHPRVAALNAYQWKSMQAAPIAPTTEQVYAAPLMRSGIEGAKATPDILTLVIGVSEICPIFRWGGGRRRRLFRARQSARRQGRRLPCWKVGARHRRGVQSAARTVELRALGACRRLLWHRGERDVGVGVSLGIFLTRKLTFYGFSIGVGVGVGGGATIVGGYTWVT